MIGRTSYGGEMEGRFHNEGGGDGGGDGGGVSRKGQLKGSRRSRGAVKRGRRLRQAVHISWLPLIIRAFL